MGHTHMGVALFYVAVVKWVFDEEAESMLDHDSVAMAKDRNQHVVAPLTLLKPSWRLALRSLFIF